MTTTGVIPITKNILVVDEFGNEYASTYVKRAKGLVKNGRARWVDEGSICLVRPLDSEYLEDDDMEMNTENKELIVETKEEAVPTVTDILHRIDRIIEQGEHLREVVTQIQNMPINESPNGGFDGEGRANAIGNIHMARETTNQKIMELLTRMYEDISPKHFSADARAAALEKVSRMQFGGVEPKTAEAILQFVSKAMEE